MSIAITFENLNNIFLQPELDYSSDSFVEPVDKIEEQVIGSEFAALREDIGDNLFNSLSEEDKQFILSTEGSVDLGYEASKSDLKRIFSSIKNDYQY